MNVVTRSVLLNSAGILAGSTLLREVLHLPWLLAWVTLVNLWLLALMVKDKKAAIGGKRRTPEATLLVLALAGGTPAIFAGRHWLRHKTVKPIFNGALIAVVVFQAAFLGWKLFF